MRNFRLHTSEARLEGATHTLLYGSIFLRVTSNPKETQKNEPQIKS